MGEKNETLDLAAQPPAVVLMAGLQGAGKTTSVAKLAKYLQEREKKKVMVVSADVYRPAAIEQLKTLASEVSAEFFPSDAGQKPVTIVNNAIAAAKTQNIFSPAAGLPSASGWPSRPRGGKLELSGSAGSFLLCLSF